MLMKTKRNFTGLRLCLFGCMTAPQQWGNYMQLPYTTIVPKNKDVGLGCCRGAKNRTVHVWTYWYLLKHTMNNSVADLPKWNFSHGAAMDANIWGKFVQAHNQPLQKAGFVIPAWLHVYWHIVHQNHWTGWIRQLNHGMILHSLKHLYKPPKYKISQIKSRKLFRY